MLADVRGVGQVPEVVLDEPQHRVGDDVVEAVVGVRLGGRRGGPRSRCRRRLHRERLPAGLARLLGVAVGHRRRDPDDLAMRREAGQRRDQAAAAARERAVDVERHRAAVGHEDEGGAVRHGVSVPAEPLRQHGVLGLLRTRAERDPDVARLAVAVDPQDDLVARLVAQRAPRRASPSSLERPAVDGRDDVAAVGAPSRLKARRLRAAAQPRLGRRARPRRRPAPTRPCSPAARSAARAAGRSAPSRRRGRRSAPCRRGAAAASVRRDGVDGDRVADALAAAARRAGSAS